MSAAIRTSNVPRSGGGRLRVGDDHAIEHALGLARVLGLDLDPDDLDVAGGRFERGAGRAGRAAEVEHAPGAAPGRGRGSPVARARRRRRGRRALRGALDFSAMAGHSKWAGIKHKKAIVDSRRGKLFTKLARAITVAAKEGGGDIVGNAALALAVQKAKDASMPKDNIERAIAKGTGEGADADALEAVMYEGYGPGGVAILVEALTDNRNRTGSEIRHAFSKHGGNLGEPGSVAYLFDKKGVVVVDGERYSEDDLMPAVDAGAEDIVLDDDVFEVLCEPADLSAVRAALGRGGDRGRRGAGHAAPEDARAARRGRRDEADEADRHARGPRRHRRGARELRRRRRDPGARRGLEPPVGAAASSARAIVTSPLHSISIAGVHTAQVMRQPPSSLLLRLARWSRLASISSSLNHARARLSGRRAKSCGWWISPSV